MIRKLALAGLFVVAATISALAQSNCTYIKTGAILTAAQWNDCFSRKQDGIPYLTLNKGGDTMLGRLGTVASGTPGAGFNIPQGAAPTSPVNGDIWTTSAGLFVRINGTTVGPIFGSLNIAGLSVLGNATTSSGFAAAITGTAGQVLEVNAGGTSLGFAATVGAGSIVRGSAGAATLRGNPTNGTTTVQDFTLQGLALRTPDANNDFLLIWDNAAGTLKKTTPGQVAASATAGITSIQGVTGAITLGSGLKVAGGLLKTENVVQVDDPAYGAVCDGSTLDTTAVQNALNSGAPVVRIPAGKTCIVDQVTLANNMTLEGSGGSVLKRKASASNTLILVGDGKHSVTVRNLTLDGNKANNTAAGGGASFATGAYDIHFENVALINNKANAGTGWGVNFDTNADATNHTSSTFRNVSCANSDNAGFLMKKVFNVSIDQMTSYNCLMAVLLDSTVGGNHESGDVSFTRFKVDCAGLANSSSIQVLGDVTSIGSIGSVYSNTVRQTWNVIVDDMQVKNCKGYGFVVQAQYFTATNVQISALDNASPGGVLLNAIHGTLSNSIISVGNLTSYSIDAGGCAYCIINGNKIDGINLNLGASQYTLVSDNVISGSGGNLISGSIYESDGNAGCGGSGCVFPWFGTDLKIIGNKLLCGASCNGIVISDGFPNLYLSDNGVSGTTSPFITIGFPVIWGGQNVDLTAAGANGNSYVLTAAGDLVVPEDTRSIYTVGSTAINTIYSFTQGLYRNGIYAVLITAPGSGYTSPPTVTQTGGTCSVAPTFYVALDGNGTLRMIRVLTPGNCSVVPTGVSISGGGGSGASAVVRAQPVPSTNGLVLNVVTSSAITLGGGPGTNIFPRTPLSPTLTGGVYQFVNVFGSWGQPQ